MSASFPAVRIHTDETMDDARLLLDYVANGSHSAFAQIVRRHVDLVYATAMRHVHDAQMADDITQAVFLLLASKAHSLRHEAVLAAWLLRAARYASLDAIKLRERRRRHETEAAEMNRSAASDNNASEQAVHAELLGMLDAALATLKESDRRVLVLRFYEKRTFPEIGQALGTTEESARKRVNRSVERLRSIFARSRSRIATAGAIAIVSQGLGQCTDAAPAGLAARVGASMSSHGVPSSIAMSVSRKMLMAEIRLWALTIGLGLCACLLGGMLVHSLLMHRDHPNTVPATPVAEDRDRSV